MKSSSLKIARDIIVETLAESQIDKVDKAELMINLSHFLEDKQYRENVKILQKRINKFKKK